MNQDTTNNTPDDERMPPGIAKAFLVALDRRRAHMLTCLSCGAKTKPGEAPPCGH